MIDLSLPKSKQSVPHVQRVYQALAAASVVALLAFWHSRVTGHLPLVALVAFVLFVLVCLAYGHAFLVATADLIQNKAGFSFQLLSGFFLFNSLLFVLSLVSSLGMLAHVSMLSLLALGLMAVGRKRQTAPNQQNTELPSLLCVIVSGMAATLWCSDSLGQLLVQGDDVVYRTWRDTFVHARHISAFAQAHGIGSMSDMRLSETVAQVYHFASYLSVAAIAGLTGTPSIDVYSSFLLPLGIFFTGLAAFSLMASILGCWPALAAAAAVVLFPDAYQQGFGNRYLSYNFIAQVNLGMLYGIACAAISWIFLLEGVRRGKVLCIFVSYLFLALSLFYKAHIFVANAYLILIYPCLFFPGLRPRWRLLAGIGLTAIFVAVVWLSQSVDRVPVLRLDGSGIGKYVLLLLRVFDEGRLHTFFDQLLRQQHSKPVDVMYVSAMLLISTFGLWVVATPIVAVAGWRKIPRAVFCFPAFIIVNYLVMTIGLAMDSRGVGTPDELLNRPLVWAYFAVAAWTAGVAYYFAFGDGLPRSAFARIGLLALLCLAMAGPLVFSRNLQTFPQIGFASYKSYNSVPQCLVKASQFIRDNSRPGDIIQESDNDPYFVVTALSERQLFLGMGVFLGGRVAEREARATGLVSFKSMRTAEELQAYAASHKISWYLLRAGAAVSWPASVIQQAVFDCGGYRVYKFPR